MGTRRFRIRRILTTAVIWGVLLTGFPTLTAEAACTATQLVPTFGRWEINQGLGSYGRLTRGKDVLVKLYLTLPSCVSTGQAITITAATLTIAGTGAAVAVTPLNPNDTSLANLSSANLAAPPVLVNSPHDPKFLVAGGVFTSPSVSPAATGSPPVFPSYGATFTVNVTYNQKVSSTQTNTGQTAQFIAPTKTVEQQSKAIRILFQPIGDGTSATVQFGESDRTAVQNAVQTLLRVLPVPAGPAGSLSATAPNPTGGIRSDINPALLDINPVLYPSFWKSVSGVGPKFCATQTAFSSLAPLLGTRLDLYNSTQAADNAADYIVGVYSENISWDSAQGCALGMASVGGKVTIARAVSDKPKSGPNPAQISMTGAVLAMELTHNFGGQPSPRSTTFHSSYVQSDNTDPDGAYNLASGLYLAADKTVMNVDTTTSPWDNSVVVFEQLDYAYDLCRLGGAVLAGAECTTPVPGGTLTGVAAINDAYVAAGNTADGVKEGYHASSAGLSADAQNVLDSTSQYRLVELKHSAPPVAPCGGSAPATVLSNKGVPVSALYTHHDNDADIPNLPGQFAFALPAALSGGADETRIVKVMNVGDNPLGVGVPIIFCALAQAQSPTVTSITPETQDLLAPGASKTLSKSLTPPRNPDGDIVFLADTTASMTDAINNVRNSASDVMSQIRAEQPDSQFGVAGYKDFNYIDPETNQPCQPSSSYPYQLQQQVTSDTDVVQHAMGVLPPADPSWEASGGCDEPEAQLYALYQIATSTDPPTGFRTNPVRPRAIGWFGDAPGHDPSGGTTEASAIDALKTAGIRVVAVPFTTPGNSGLDSTGQATRIANATGGAVKPAGSSREVANALLAGLLSATVEPRNVTCDAGLSLSIDGVSFPLAAGTEPPRHVVRSGTEAATFSETVTISPTATDGKKSCGLDFYVNGTQVLSGGSPDPNFHQVISIAVGSTKVTVQAQATSGNQNSLADFVYHCPGTAFFPVATAVPHTGTPSVVSPGVFSLLFEMQIDAGLVPGGACTLTALVSDMFQRSSLTDPNATTTFNVTKKKPRDLAIYTPIDGTLFGTRATVIATGGATDPEGGSIDLAWSLSGPGGFTAGGSGPRVSFTGPGGVWATGDYVVALTATDNDGVTNRCGPGSPQPICSVTFKIVADSALPPVYSFNGFFTPAKNWPAVNQVNAGQAFAAKWTFRDSSGQEVTTDGIFGARLDQVSCSTRAFIVNVFDWPVGGTMVRYDAKGAQWVANVNIPAGVGNCYTWTLELKDGSLHQLFFQATK